MIKFSQATFPRSVGWVPARRSFTKDLIPFRVSIVSWNPACPVAVWPHSQCGCATMCVNHLGECRCIICANADAHAMKCEEVQVAS